MKTTSRVRLLVPSIVLCFAFLVLWFFKVNEGFQPTSATSMESFEQLGGAQNSEALRALMTKCYGFTNECELENLGLKLRLTFEGWSWLKPHYVFVNMFGGSTGWQRTRTYYGKRILQVSKSDGQQIAEFKQILWNSSEYSDFSQVIALDEKAHKLYISSMPTGFTTLSQSSFPITY